MYGYSTNRERRIPFSTSQSHFCQLYKYGLGSELAAIAKSKPFRSTFIRVWRVGKGEKEAISLLSPPAHVSTRLKQEYLASTLHWKFPFREQGIVQCFLEDYGCLWESKEDTCPHPIPKLDISLNVDKDKLNKFTYITLPHPLQFICLQQ